MHLPCMSRRDVVALGAVLVAVVGIAGCVPGRASTLAPASDFAFTIDSIYWLLLWLSAAVFIGVEAALVYAMVRFRRRPGQGIPPQVHGSVPLEIAWTILPALILVVIAVPTMRAVFATQTSPTVAAATTDPPMVVRIIGHQWWWEVRYPEQNVVTANEVHLPLNQQVDLQLETADVIHSFWVPRLGGKRDLIPGKVNHIYMTPTVAEEFYGQCAEFCGIQHANMKLRVFVEPTEQFDAWIRANQQPAPSGAALPSDLARQGEQVFMSSACVGCHAIQGTVAAAQIGPNLTHFGSRSTIASGVLENTPENLARWIRNPQEVKPGNAMPQLRLTEDQISALVAYLESLK